jgi:hypothetical protein
MFSNIFSPKFCPLWGNVEKYGSAEQTTDDNMIWRMRFLSLLSKATEEHSEYVIIISIRRQQWLRERTSVLRYTYTASATFLNKIVLRPIKCYLFKIISLEKNIT